MLRGLAAEASRELYPIHRSTFCAPGPAPGARDSAGSTKPCLPGAHRKTKTNKQNPSARTLGSCPSSRVLPGALLHTNHCLGLLSTWHQPLPGKHLTTDSITVIQEVNTRCSLVTKPPKGSAETKKSPTWSDLTSAITSSYSFFPVVPRSSANSSRAD